MVQKVNEASSGGDGGVASNTASRTIETKGVDVAPASATIEPPIIITKAAR